MLNVTRTPRAFVRIIQVAVEFFGVTSPAQAAAESLDGAADRLDGQVDFLPFLQGQRLRRFQDAVLVGSFNFQGHWLFSAARFKEIVLCRRKKK